LGGRIGLGRREIETSIGESLQHFLEDVVDVCDREIHVGIIALDNSDSLHSRAMIHWNDDLIYKIPHMTNSPFK
jgi:hypothetical protein